MKDNSFKTFDYILLVFHSFIISVGNLQCQPQQSDGCQQGHGGRGQGHLVRPLFGLRGSRHRRRQSIGSRPRHLGLRRDVSADGGSQQHCTSKAKLNNYRDRIEKCFNVSGKALFNLKVPLRQMELYLPCITCTKAD